MDLRCAGVLFALSKDETEYIKCYQLFYRNKFNIAAKANIRVTKLCRNASHKTCSNVD